MSSPSLEGFAAAVIESRDSGVLAARASELDAVDRLFAADPALRSAMTDTAVSATARRAVLGELLEGKVEDAVRRTVAFAAGAVPSQEVPGAISWLAHRFRALAEGAIAADQVTEGLGHSAARRRVGGFAAAVFESLDAAGLDEIEDELFRFARTVETTSALRSALTDRELPGRVRADVVVDLLGGKVASTTVDLVSYVAIGGRVRDFVGTLYWLADQAAAERGWRIALVDSALEIDGDTREHLAGSLRSMTGMPVDLQVNLDPALLAGIRVRIGDLQFDASARSRLDAIREHLVPGGWEDAGYGKSSREGAH